VKQVTENRAIPEAIAKHFTDLIEQGYDIGLHGPDTSGTLKITDQGKLVITQSGSETWKGVEEFVKDELGAKEHLVRLAELVNQVVTSRHRPATQPGNSSDREQMVQSLAHHLKLNGAAAEAAGESSSPKSGPDH